jgi:hypothetical protein
MTIKNVTVRFMLSPRIPISGFMSAFVKSPKAIRLKLTKAESPTRPCSSVSNEKTPRRDDSWQKFSVVLNAESGQVRTVCCKRAGRCYIEMLLDVTMTHPLAAGGSDLFIPIQVRLLLS